MVFCLRRKKQGRASLGRTILGRTNKKNNIRFFIRLVEVLNVEAHMLVNEQYLKTNINKILTINCISKRQIQSKRCLPLSLLIDLSFRFSQYLCNKIKKIRKILPEASFYDFVCYFAFTSGLFGLIHIDQRQFWRKLKM